MLFASKAVSILEDRKREAELFAKTAANLRDQQYWMGQAHAYANAIHVLNR